MHVYKIYRKYTKLVNASYYVILDEKRLTGTYLNTIIKNTSVRE